jgi:hypothetical protein
VLDVSEQAERRRTKAGGVELEAESRFGLLLRVKYKFFFFSSERPMPTCFVIQPFDAGGKFDKRFKDTFKPAIESAGLDAYRVDQDASVSVPIDAIERGIQQATICLADITEDNPNVWYELGYAFALGKPVVMVCSEERAGKKYPFDIQHRYIIKYKTEATSDFDDLKQRISEKLLAMLSNEAMLEQIAESEPLAPVQGLGQNEMFVLAIVAGAIHVPEAAIGIYAVRNDAERAGITGMGVNLALRQLERKGFVSFEKLWDDQSQEEYAGVSITNSGWEWLSENEAKFILHRRDKLKSTLNFDPFDPDVPF